MLSSYLSISDEVKKALENNQPVVALESTIISHGMPWPQNMETALKCESIIREQGAVPATIGIIEGQLVVGLNKEQIEYMSKAKDVLKVSRRDIPFIIAKKLNGATTVASTMIIAALAGVKIFVTGGIGGVHRGASETFDVSADLMELANTNVAVICAGCKSILDIGLTLEYLETHGVPVVGFQSKELAAFYSRRSGYQVDYQVESAQELAEALYAKWELGLNGGMVISNPVPVDDEMPYDVINEAIDSALEEAEEKEIKGKEVTPFLLSRIKQITDGNSLQTNQALVFNNAKVGAQLAVEFAKKLQQ